jgi:hypothetical protein
MSNETFASVWDAIEYTPAEAENMKLRSTLMMDDFKTRSLPPWIDEIDEGGYEAVPLPPAMIVEPLRLRIPPAREEDKWGRCQERLRANSVMKRMPDFWIPLPSGSKNGRL